MSLFKTTEDEDWITLQMFGSPQTSIVNLEGAQVWAHAFKHFRLPYQHGNSRFCTCLINVTVSSPLPLFTDQQFFYCHGACLSSFILTHKIQELNHWALNLLPPVLQSPPSLSFSVFLTVHSSDSLQLIQTSLHFHCTQLWCNSCSPNTKVVNTSSTLRLKMAYRSYLNVLNVGKCKNEKLYTKKNQTMFIQGFGQDHTTWKYRKTLNSELLQWDSAVLYTP